MTSPTSDQAQAAQAVKPEGFSDEQLQKMLRFLDNIREDGKINMLGAGPYLREMYDLDKAQSHAVLFYWTQTFSQRKEQAQ